MTTSTLQVAYLRKPKTTGRPISERLGEDELVDRIRHDPRIQAYTDHIRSAPDIQTKGPEYDRRKSDKTNQPHAAALSLNGSRNTRLSPVTSGLVNYTGLVHLDIDDLIDPNTKERVMLPDPGRAWVELSALPFRRTIGHSFSGMMWLTALTSNTTIAGHQAAWEHVLSLLPIWIQPFVGRASSAVNGLRYIAHCGCVEHDPGSEVVEVPAGMEAAPASPATKTSRARPSLAAPLGRELPLRTSELPWLGLDQTTSKLLALDGAVRASGGSIRMSCPAHSGSASAHHLVISPVNGRLAAKCFSDKCSASYHALAAAIEKLIDARLSEFPQS